MNDGPAMTETTKLLPCPFCGGKAELNTWGNDRDGCHVAKVICDSCSASADSFETQDQAITAWNWRSARKWDVSFMRALSESTHNALVQKAIAEASEASESLSAENARLREALREATIKMISDAFNMGLAGDVMGAGWVWPKNGPRFVNITIHKCCQALRDAPDAKKGE